MKTRVRIGILILAILFTYFTYAADGKKEWNIDELWWVIFIVIVPVTILLKKALNHFDGRR